MSKTALDIVVRASSELKPSELSELRKLWVHGVQTDTHAVGWLPTGAFDSRVQTDDVTTVYRDGDLVGWVLRGESRARKVLKIYQIWVRPDARILEHGRALTDRLEEICGRTSCSYLEAWVAEDLEANIFWRAIGFTRTVWRWGRGGSTRKIFRWVKAAGGRGLHSGSFSARLPGAAARQADFFPLEFYDVNSGRFTHSCGAF